MRGRCELLRRANSCHQTKAGHIEDIWSGGSEASGAALDPETSWQDELKHCAQERATGAHVGSDLGGESFPGTKLTRRWRVDEE
ncbi:unnamed protein product [Menidia menidia]|uniref:(Atlantic silverside) hypothetical protein n=1 Tax=Menidia menidia TaxID=238744 RepID=A0A8S4AYF2_9TELE|nr:unnamed protein product [Menidia menidia]